MDIPDKNRPLPPMHSGSGFNPPPGGEVPLPPPMMDTSHIKRKWLDISYADLSPMQKLDIYLPEYGEGPFPVVMVFHGGAWMIGDKGEIQQLPNLKGLEIGYAVICVNYRLSGEAQFPAQIHDSKAAIRFVKAHAHVYQLNKNRIAAWGASAGAHLAALLGTSAHVRDLEDLSMGNAQESCDVQVVVDWFGPAENFLMMDEELIKSGKGVADHSGAMSPESMLLGRIITEIPDLVKAASPMTYITKDVPYFLIQHGAMDAIVPVEQSTHFAAELERIAGKDKVILEVLEGAGHADPAFETQQNVNRVFSFLDGHLKQPPGLEA
jgi:acetyl esterase/lipase